MIWAGRGFAAMQSVHQKDLAQGFFEAALQFELLALEGDDHDEQTTLALSRSIASLACRAGSIETCLLYVDKVLALNPPAEIAHEMDMILDMVTGVQDG
jgi:hypothetical protein